MIGAARGEAKLDLVRSLGAEAAVDYSKPGWVDQVRAGLEERTTAGKSVLVP
ncbi:hypothetical protein [Nocardiopsis sp. CNR-923]|uniref:hypothetical protein n=1 Tax=Nocardiopsis sp. CNR-923 TaxID=1904965 RepID=UPI0021CCB843|nr:hypothetical protein [Nocardiopsis sp. CNR-923]